MNQSDDLVLEDVEVQQNEMGVGVGVVAAKKKAWIL